MKKIILLTLSLLNIICANAQCWGSVSVKSLHSLAIRNDSTLWAWGYNSVGQLGNGNTDGGSSTPIQISSQKIWKCVAVGSYHSLAIKNDGTLWAWGYNIEGELGNGTYSYYETVRAQVGTDNDWQYVYAGFNNSFAIKTNGTLWGWGFNGNSELGDGTINNRNFPGQIGISNNWKSASPAGQSTLAIKTDGTIWGWGNAYGITPTQIDTDVDWQSVSKQFVHSLGIKTNGDLWAWGQNTYGQLGNGTTQQGFIPPAQIGTSSWKYISAGDFHSLAINADGTLWAWGRNDYGAVGDGTNNSRNMPVQISTATNWQAVFAGSNYSIAMKSDLSLWAWGKNDQGQLGDGTYVDKNLPTQIICNAALPVKLLFFTAKKQDSNVLLSWQTATEQNNKEFQIERSEDGTFKKLGTVISKNNISGGKYTYVDAHPISGQNYYRLKSVDIDGKYSYSNIQEVTFKLNGGQVKVYPNPAKDILSIESNFKGEMLDININDIAGRKILQMTKQNNKLIDLPIAHLKAGIYLLKISDGVTSVSKKIIKE